MDLAKNQDVTLEITGMTAEGSGVGRYDGQVVFVPFTAVGDTVCVRIVKVQKGIAYGRVEEVLTPSPDRCAETGCPVYGKCGGCTYRHLTYEAELAAKWQRVADAVRRIGGLSVIPEPIVPSERTDRYRNKAEYPLCQGEDGGVRVGFFAPRSHRVVPVADCALQPEGFAPIAAAVCRWAGENGVSLYDETTKRGLLRHLYLREAETTGEILVCLVCTSGKLPAPEKLIAALREFPAVVGIVVDLNREDTNVILGKKYFTLWGKDTVTDTLCGVRVRLSPLSFYQVNRRQAERLYALAREAAGLTGRETLFDLYCGTGTIGLSMADGAKTLIGVEVIPEAVEDARRNAEENGIKNARFLCDDAAGAAEKLAAEGVRPDVVIVDPPRKGCAPELIGTIAAMAPDRVVYVSCDPATLARDLKLFAEKGYLTKKITPVDMFPCTPHVETVVLMFRT